MTAPTRYPIEPQGYGDLAHRSGVWVVPAYASGKEMDLATLVRELVGMTLIGDGVVGALIPSRHARRWSVGPKPWQRTMRTFAARPQLTRLLALGEGCLGLWIALRRR